ncbi:la protein homolog [Dysidea avara]|uniref:la protein homolog n=1 Tax=Dysidea avara TaxID=196820 RepID=UPI00332CC263
MATEAEPAGVLENKIIRQVEFYFGDRNLRRDKFLIEQVKKDDGWVPFTVLLTFNRLKQLSTDAEVVAAALKKSTALEVSDDNTKVRRLQPGPLPDPMERKSSEQHLQEQQRTVYVKGFPLDSTLDTLQDFFDQFGVTDIITMRKNKIVDADGKVTYEFKGSVFVEYKDKADAANLMEKDEVKYNDTVLLKEYKADYIKRKRQEEADKKQAAKEVEEKKRKEALPKVEYTHGHIMKFVGCGGNTSREQLKELFSKYATVLWIDFNRGETEGFIRFQEEDGARRAVDGATGDAEDGKVLLQGVESVLSVAEGDEEKAFYTRMEENKAKPKGGAGGNYKKGRKRQKDNRPVRGRQQAKQNSKQDSGDHDNAKNQQDSGQPEDEPSNKRVKQEPEDGVPSPKQESNDAETSSTQVKQESEDGAPGFKRVTQESDDAAPSPKRVKQESDEP